ncbi:MAG TPA: DUF1998 domain-containing protein [Arachnia sp.]|nr:DUF1998 domain-containing protein [Arachnia sp.]
MTETTPGASPSASGVAGGTQGAAASPLALVGINPVKDDEELRAAAKAGKATKRNRAKVGSARPSSLMFTYGPGAIVDLPNFTVLPTGYEAWDYIWQRVRTEQGVLPVIRAPKLLADVRQQLGPQVAELRPFPYLPESGVYSTDGVHLGVPAVMFPQWYRCTACDLLAPLGRFGYRNTNPYRPDEAVIEHEHCPKKKAGKGNARVVPARYLLACTNGHLDEFPYEQWVHGGVKCPKAEAPILHMRESTMARGASATIECWSCVGAKEPGVPLRRGMNEAQGRPGREKLPRCRGRRPHLVDFDPAGCPCESHLMVVGASNLWFPLLSSVIVLPTTPAERADELVDALRPHAAKLAKYAGDLEVLRDVLDGKVDVGAVSDADLLDAVTAALVPASPASEFEPATTNWLDLMAPEWELLTRPLAGGRHEDADSGLTLRTRQLHEDLPAAIKSVLAVERLRKATALLGFTRIDEMDRIDDLNARRSALSVGPPTWVVATLDRGEGVFLTLDEARVAAWEKKVEASDLWAAHKASHERNFANRQSETAGDVTPGGRLRPPRYWLLHTLSHALLREMAMSSGYGAASISERLYAWKADGVRPAAAGVLLLTTSSDSDGTLGGLVALSEPKSLAEITKDALRKALRCSADPVCGHRTPVDPEDFLHGAACHCCSMASETSCERANRFLDRRFLVPLPGPYADLAFFEAP